MKLVSILVVNWNSRKYIAKCLQSVFSQRYQEIELILVDNGSVDGSLELVKKQFPNIHLIENDRNVGFAKAVNQGIAESIGDFIMPLNPDVLLSPNYVSEMMKAALLDEKIGSVSPKLLRRAPGEEGTIDSAGHIIFRNRLVENRGVDETDIGQYGQQEYVFGASGAAPLYKREMLEEIRIDGEYYDEDFFAFWEDIDLDWRAQLRGWKCIYNPKAVAYHYRGGIRMPRPRFIEFHNYKNRYFTIIKNDYFFGLVKNLHHLIFTDFIKASALLIRCPKALLAWVEVLKMLPRMRAKRRTIQERVVVKPRNLEQKWFKKFNYRRWFKRHLVS